jgi:hypothetical protein
VSSWFWSIGPRHKILATLASSAGLLGFYFLLIAHLGSWTVPPPWVETPKANSGLSIDPLNTMTPLEAVGLLLGIAVGHSLITSRGLLGISWGWSSWLESGLA